MRLEPVAAPRVAAAARCGPRALLAAGGALWHGSSAALDSALKRAPNLKPSFAVAKVKLTDNTAPHLLRVRLSSGISKVIKYLETCENISRKEIKCDNSNK